MKIYITLFAILLFVIQVFGQETTLKDCSNGNLMEEELVFKAFQFNKHGFSIKGDLADEFVDELKSSHKFKQRGFRTFVKHVDIPNMAENTNIEILEGIHGYDPEKSCYYFHIFTSEEQKAEIIANLTEYQKVGYSIYMKNKNFSDEDREMNSKSVSKFAQKILASVSQ
jgi:hypothetical protein